jgi:outer membrane protein insertion porin family
MLTLSMTAKGLGENINRCLTRPSISAGVGLLYRFDPVRVEVNFGVPLVASQSDGMRRGFQVGIGMEFL